MSFGPLKRGEAAPAFTPAEIEARRCLLDIVKDVWPVELQDEVFLRDTPTPATAARLVQRYGVRRAQKLIEGMNE
jgi:hypothetical protein